MRHEQRVCLLCATCMRRGRRPMAEGTHAALAVLALPGHPSAFLNPS